MSIPIIQMLFIGMLPSWLKVRLYRLRGARIGKRARIGIFSVLLATEIEIGDDCQIGFATVIKAKKIALGNRVKIGTLVAIDTNELSVGHDSVIMEQNFVGGMRTPRSRLQIGSRVKIFPFCFINPTEPIVIEDDVGIGGSNYLFTHGSWQSGLDGFPVVFGPIRIRKGAWLPWRVFVMPNVEIGTYATLGAGSVVTRSIPGYSLAVGTPARIISENKSHIRFLDESQKWLYLTQIVEQFRELLEFDGLTTQLTSGAGKLELQVWENEALAGAYTFVDRDEQLDKLNNNDIIVSLYRLSIETRERLRIQSISWFDIETGVMEFGGHHLSHLVRDFLSRFGIRFAVESDPPWINN